MNTAPASTEPHGSFLQCPPPPHSWLLEAPVRNYYPADAHPSAHKSVLEPANPAWTRSVHLDAPGQRHRQQPVSGTADPGVVKQDKSSGGSVDTTKTRSGPQRVRMSSGERPIGTAKGKRPNTEALCRPPPSCSARPSQWLPPYHDRTPTHQQLAPEPACALRDAMDPPAYAFPRPPEDGGGGGRRAMGGWPINGRPSEGRGCGSAGDDRRRPPREAHFWCRSLRGPAQRVAGLQRTLVQ